MTFAPSSEPESAPGVRVGILLSGRGRGSNMQALIDATRDGSVRGEVVLVVGTTPEAPALQRAEAAGVPTRLVDAAQFGTPEELDRALTEAFAEADVSLVCLAGFMRLLGPEFLSRFGGRVMNIHPALLPAFGGRGYYGRRVHEAVIETGVRITGVTVHFVDEEYDHGPIILQRPVEVRIDDTAETLAARVLQEEHAAYPEAVRLFAEGRLQIEGRRVRILPASRGRARRDRTGEQELES